MPTFQPSVLPDGAYRVNNKNHDYWIVDKEGNIIGQTGANGQDTFFAVATTDPLTGVVKYSSSEGVAFDVVPFAGMCKTAGATLDGSQDDGPAIQSVLNTIATITTRSKLTFPRGAIVRLDTGISIDVSKISVDFAGAVIRPVGAITAITLTANSAPEANNINKIEGFEIDGDLSAGQVGLYLYNPAAVPYGPGPSRIILSNFAIKQCDIGYQIGSAAYGMEHYAWTVFECNTGIKCPAGLTDAYELPRFFSGFLSNNLLGIDIGDGQLTFIGSSIDYNRKQAVMTGGRISLIGCHVESNLKRSTYSAGQTSWDLSGKAVLTMTNGRLIHTAGAGTDLDTIFNVATSPEVGGGVWLDRVTLSNCKPASGYLAKGAGNFYSTGCIADSDTPMPDGAHQTFNMLDYGTFEGAIFPTDLVSVSAGGTLSSRIASTNVTLTQGAAAARTGSNGLIITKNTAAGASGTADVIILAPITNKDAMHNGVLYYRHGGASARQITIQFGYFKCLNDVYGTQVCPQVKDVAYALNSNITLPGADTGWVKMIPALPYRRPPKNFDYVGFRVRVHDMNSTEALWIDDVEIHQF